VRRSCSMTDSLMPIQAAPVDRTLGSIGSSTGAGVEPAFLGGLISALPDIVGAGYGIGKQQGWW
jgi:hypothetical protein